MSSASANTQAHSQVSRWKWVYELASIDLRALAFLRIGVASILLVDLAYRARDLGAFYTDGGILPRAGRMNLAIQFCEPWWMSLHMLSGSLVWASLLAIVAAAAAVALLLGWRTKIALAVSWLLLYSIQARFPMLLQGGDVLLRCALVWMFFLPIDKKWSLRRPAASDVGASTISSIAVLGLIVQVGSMYFFSALLKTSPMWVGDFSATYYALHIDHFTTPLGYALAEYPSLLALLTFAAIVLEFCGPLLMLEPVGRRIWRWLIPLSFIGFHLGLYFCMDLGTFPWICIVCWAALLPSPIWDRIDFAITKWGKAPSVNPARQATLSPWNGSAAGNAIAGFLLLYVLSLNTAKLRHPYAEVGAFPIRHIGRLTGLEQYWNMFAPGPYPYGSWVRVEGMLPSGELVNLYDPARRLADQKPQNVSDAYPTQYWRRCFVMGCEVRERPHLEGLLKYLASRWNRDHGPSSHIIRARFVFMKTPTPPPGKQKNDQADVADANQVQPEVLCELDFSAAALASN